MSSCWHWTNFSSCIRSVEDRCCNCVICFHCFPSFTTLLATFIQVSLFFLSVPFVLSGFLWLQEGHLFRFPHLFVWSSHCSVCLVLGAEAWVPFCCFLSLSIAYSGNDAIFIAKRHFILLCVSTQHGIFAVFILSTAIIFFINFTCVYLFIGVFHEGNVNVLGRNRCQNRFPSAVSSSELLWTCLFFFFIFLVSAGLGVVFAPCLDDEARHFALS